MNPLEKLAACSAPALPKQWREGPIAGVELSPLRFHHDQRGWLTELFRQDELPETLWPVMGYLSQTLPGVTRGPHQHREQTDVFVFLGPGEFEVGLWDIRPGPSLGHRQILSLGAHRPTRLVVPPGVVHAYRNVSDQPGWVLNFPNRLYRGWKRSQEVDELRWEQMCPEAFPW